MTQTPGVNGNSGVQPDQRDDLYAGPMPPSYLTSNDPGVIPPATGTDSTTISASGSGAATGTPVTSSVPTATPTDPGYIRTDTSTEGGKLLSLGSDADSGTQQIWNDFVANGGDSSLYTKDSNGYYVIDEKKLESIFEQLLSFAAMRLIGTMEMDQREEILEKIAKAFSDNELPTDEAKTTKSESIAKSNQKLMKLFQQGVTILLEMITTKNNAVLDQKIQDAEAQKGSAWGNFWSSNGDEKKSLQMEADAKSEYKSAMEKSLNALSQIMKQSFSGATPSAQAHGQAVFNQLGDSGDHIKYDSNGYIDLAQSKQWIVNLRSELVGILNLDETVASLAAEKESTIQSVSDAFTGEANNASRLGALQDQIEGANAHETMIFDRAASEVLGIQKTTNDIRNINLQIEKLDKSHTMNILRNICMAVAVVASVTALVAGSLLLAVFTGGSSVLGAIILISAIVGVAAGAAAAGLNYGAAALANSVNDSYHPTLDTYSATHQADGKSKHGLLDESEELQYEEEAYIDAIGSGQIDGLGDGYQAVNMQEVGSISNRLNGSRTP